MDGGILGGLAIGIEGVEAIPLSTEHGDIVIPGLGRLEGTSLRLLAERGTIRLLLAETLVEGLPPVLVDIVQTSGQRSVADRRVILVADHLRRVRVPVSQRRV